jgi:DNA-3-methyladenine glycosylase II
MTMLTGIPPGKGAGSVTEDSSRAVWLQQARSYLRNADPVLARLIDDRPAFDPRAWMAQLPPMDLYGALLFQVTGQQLSVPATRRTLARIQALFDGHLPSPTELLGVDPGKLREAGLSWRKIRTLRDLAERLSDGRLNPNVLSSLPDDELMAELTAIPGIGPWTVQGALIIALQREDVVLPGDLALRKAVQVAYQLDHLPTQQEVLAIAENWRPYRSLATSYLFPPPSSGPRHRRSSRTRRSTVPAQLVIAPFRRVPSPQAPRWMPVVGARWPTAPRSTRQGSQYRRSGPLAQPCPGPRRCPGRTVAPNWWSARLLSRIAR